MDKLESIEIQGNKSLTRMNKDKTLGTFIVGEYITILPVTLNHSIKMIILLLLKRESMEKKKRLNLVMDHIYFR